MEDATNVHEKVIESFSSGKCPVCELLRKDEFRFLCDWVSVSDEKHKGSAERARLTALRGFCNYHFWDFERLSSDYGSASVGAQLLEELIKCLQTPQSQRVDKMSHGLRGGDACPMCRDLEEKEMLYLKELRTLLGGDEYKAKYRAGAGLCMPHFIKEMGYVEDDDLLKFLFQSELEQMERIRTNAVSFASKRESPLRWQMSDAEKNAFFLAIEKLVGKRGT